MEGKYKRARKKRLQEFSGEDKIQLIRNVESRPVLWDLSNKSHFDATILKKAWEGIAREMDKDDHSCKLAWKSLRDSYKYHLKSKRTKSAEGDPLGKPKGMSEWDFAPYMAFLPEVTTQRQTTRSCYSEIEEAMEQSYSIDESLNYTEDLKEEAELEVSLELPSYAEERRTAKKRKVEQSPAAKICGILGNYLQQQQNTTIPTPARPIFVYWESELNSLSPEDAAEVEQKMTRLLWEEKAARN
ncbi:uncharacterized protein LOC108040070 [Drosophila rhopaloa]|uniref:Uncharacterized protein LOC108040070 n=1 Tax=Drosophila rhopaloa TaxID=1041015 RepID=A0A6P4EHN0_DRORH|nr:uncharacterized protein LOC108040070 [Drosophila rhopaloa]